MNLTIEQMREIVDGTPEGATHIVSSTYLKLVGAGWWEAWLPAWKHDVCRMVYGWKGESIELLKTWGGVYKLNDLRAALADHDRTDYVSDIRNHISPTTVVIER
ncbi:hypothetical protein ACVCFZ_05270 [Acinetobacter variabilis]